MRAPRRGHLPPPPQACSRRQRAGGAAGTLVAGVLTAGLVAAGVLVAGPAHAAEAADPAAPDFEVPFSCGEDWVGSTRPDHRPSVNAVDFNRPDDLGALLVATAPGVVSRVENSGSSSYGRWIVVDHGNGWSSLYAHLMSQWVARGQRVDQGTVLGRVGSTGGSSGAHLHFEERYGSAVQAPAFHRTAFTGGPTGPSLNCPDSPLAGDWNGDGVDDVAVFHREAGRGVFELAGPETVIHLAHGSSTDVPVVGDWNGDGVTDVGVRRHLGRQFLLRQPDGTTTKVRLGRVADRPVTGDWDGDGTADLGVWQPRRTAFRLLLADGRQQLVRLGSVGSDPVTGDWDGDGITDLGVFDAATGSFTLRTVAADGTVALATVAHGTSTDLPVTGDWNGDGRTDVGTWSPQTAVFTLRTAPPPTRARARAAVSTFSFGRPR